VADPASLYRLVSYLPLLAVLALACQPWARNIFRHLSPDRRWQISMVGCGLGLVLSAAYLVDASYNPFLYFRF
jgi:alginate O-acetyltransferase complex protein AlgI